MTTDTATVETYVFRLTPAEFQATREKIAKIQARAEKRGFTGGLSLNGLRTEVTTKDAITGFEITEVVYETTLTGTAPSYAGWSFIARVDALNDTFTIATAPGVTNVDRSLVKVGQCDHCGAARYRKNTYLVRNDETGEVKNVGSSCIKDFLGWSASVVFLSDSDVVREIESGWGGGERAYNVDTILAISYASIRAFGWVAASSYDGIPTRSDVHLVLNPPQNLTRDDKARLAALSPLVAEAEGKAAEIRAFILSDDFNGNSTFIENMKVAAGEDTVTSKQIGILAYAPQALIKHTEGQVVKVAREKAQSTSEYIGAEKDKVTLTVTLSAIRYIPGQYGTTTLYTFVTEDGNIVKWFASTTLIASVNEVEREGFSHYDDKGMAVNETWIQEVAVEAVVGDVITLKGTVKGHEEYKGVKSTILTRCKAV